jgi:hypothetical protein
LIFGFNTDVKHGDSVYHVQSEARVHDHLLQTQVFVKGRCIGKRATSYADQVDLAGFSDQHMQTLLKEQHRFLVNAVRGGRIDDELANPTPINFPEIGDPGTATQTNLHLNAEAAPNPPDAAVPSSAPTSDAAGDPGVLAADARLEISGADVLDPAGMSEMVAEMDAAPRAIVQPAGKPIGSGLEIECINPDTAYDGTVAIVKILVTEQGDPVPEAQLACRATIGKNPPLHFYSSTQHDGSGEIHVDVNESDLSNATLLIQATHRSKNVSRRFKLVKP